MKSYIIFIPAIFATLYMMFLVIKGSQHPAAKGFLNFYLPSLLLLPQEFEAPIPLLPDPTFAQATLIPVLIAYFILPNKTVLPATKGLRLLDVTIVGFIATCVITEYISSGLHTVQTKVLEEDIWKTVLYRNVFNILIPYYLARKLIYPLNLTAPFFKRIIILTLISLISTAYEWRFVVNIHEEIFKPFFNNVGEITWIPSYRFGLVRLSGPFLYPILFGTVLGVALILNHWLTKNKLWKGNFKFIPLPPYIKGFLIGSILFIGLILTFSRGPLYSAILAFFIIGLGYSRHKFIGILVRVFLFAVLGTLLYQWVMYYSEINIDLASASFGRTAAYRAQLIKNYIKYIAERPWIGWGTYSWPEAAGMRSIDNEYLWLVLKHGLIALVFLSLTFAIACLKLLYVGLKIPYAERMDQSLAFTLLSAVFMLAATLATVFMGGQVEPVTFMVIGLSQGFLDTYYGRERKPAAPLFHPARS